MDNFQGFAGEERRCKVVDEEKEEERKNKEIQESQKGGKE